MRLTTLNTQGLTKAPRSIGAIMMHVMLALVPGTLLYAWLIDVKLIFNIVMACAAALFFETLLLALRNRPIRPALSDGSIVLAAWLLTLCVPQSLPVWQLLIGVFVMTAIGKHLFGGLGHNPFNPAMVAYAVLIVSFPVTMTNWSPASHIQNSDAAVVESASLSDWDGVTGATALDRIRNYKLSNADSGVDNHAKQVSEDTTRLTNQQAGQLVMSTPWIWISLAWLAGGLYLLYIKIISWHIPVSVLGSLSALYFTWALLGSNLTLPLLPALLSGAIMVGAFFIATDPVSAAASNTGKLIYGIGIGLLTFIIREFSVYPEGFAFAVLLMNICVPLIDHLCSRNTGRASAMRDRQ